MDFLNATIGTWLGYLMYACYALLGGYGAAVLLFTLLTKAILFPLSLAAQKNSIKMVRMAPALAEIKGRNAGNGELLIEEQRELYKKEKYSTVAGVLPLLVQIPIILGLINVIYHPLQHLLRMGAGDIGLLVERAASVLGTTAETLSYSAQLRVLEAVQADPSVFADLGISAQIEQILQMDVTFLGLDLAQIPYLGTPEFAIPVLSGASALALSLVQNKYNVLQAEAGFFSKWGMAIFLVCFSAYFAYVLPCGLGLYWTAGNFLSIPVQLLCNVVYNPKKYIDYENRRERPKLPSAEKAKIKARAKMLAIREKEDTARFFSKANAPRELVVYAEGRGFYKYFKGFLEYILAHSGITIHYVTSDFADGLLDARDPRVAGAGGRLKTYYVGEKALIPFFMKLDADIMLMTTPDLERYHLKRSLVRKDIEYIYTDHGISSFHLMLREGALDHFDTIFCIGPNHIDEVRQTEWAYGLPQKTLVKTGFGLLDELLENVTAMDIGEGDTGQILVAPSWQRDNLLVCGDCLDRLMDSLLGHGWRVVVRPHPEFVKRFPARLEAIRERYEGRAEDGFVLETDFSSNQTVYTSDVVITDWSSIAMEFSYATKKPSLFVNTPMKVMNPAYGRIPSVPLDIALRDELGVSVDIERIDGIADIAADLIAQKGLWRERIETALKHYVYNIGDGSRIGGDYIISRVAYAGSLRDFSKEAR
ncbi:MAG: membrane protein insertase YidC [Clostridiales Family XIII bacterium]|jgi:YidC/Oxa1 family membrane protein insertase|nr:membrane protein insertase YidC [Clostridiales Family XIII bacterium]